MISVEFSTPIQRDGPRLTGPWRAPRQMLADQAHTGHGSIHDDRVAKGLGFKAGTIEGPTHFTQFVPLACALWGSRFVSDGCISAHYRNAVFEGEEVQAQLFLESEHSTHAAIRMEKRDGTEVLTGTMSVGSSQAPSALDVRLRNLGEPRDLVILKDLKVGMKTGRIPVSMGLDQHMGELYPFTLRQKLVRMTEPSETYREIIPFEMVSVLLNHIARQHAFPARGPAVSLFADQEIRMIDGPLRVGEDYEVEREIVALSDSRRTESSWVLTRVFPARGAKVVATMLLNTAVLKDSYPAYAEELAELQRSRVNV